MIADEEIHRHIDPGSTGCIAMIPEEGDIELYPLEKDTLLTMCQAWCMDDCFCVLEHVTSSPQMGVTSAFTFAEGFGFVQGVLAGFFISTQLVKPQVWKKFFGCICGKDVSPKDKKQKDYEVASRLFPTVDFRRTPRCKTIWFDAADAILLAEYGRRMYK